MVDVSLVDWHSTAEGETFLQQLYNVKSNGRKLFGILEKPSVFSCIEEVYYKLVFFGKASVGKTAAINRLAGISSNSCYLETSGIRITDIYWPVKIWDKVILFKLKCWDAGNNSMKKFNHIPSSCIDKADFAVFVFSYADVNSFIELPQMISKSIKNCGNQPGIIVIGTSYNSANTEVKKTDIRDFELKHNICVLNMQIGSFSETNEALKVAPLLNTICEHLWMRDQQYILKQGVTV